MMTAVLWAIVGVSLAVLAVAGLNWLNAVDDNEWVQSEEIKRVEKLNRGL